MDATLASSLPILLGLAWLLPLATFTLIVLFGPRMGKHGVGAAYLATFAIVVGFLFSVISLGLWLSVHGVSPTHAAAEETAIDAARHTEVDTPSHHGEANVPDYYSGDLYSLGEFGSLKITIGYYIDALTVGMFAMVTLIASCIHFYAIGYMHDELHDVTDHEVTLANGHHLHRPGRFHRFFQYLSLFCFSMLGLLYAGNILMVFVFWELVGICSYFLIGFYIERHSAANAANKAFIVNRVGDFGMIIGLMALWAGLGTFAFGDKIEADGSVSLGIFSQVRDAEHGHELTVPDGMVRAAAFEMVQEVVLDHRKNPDPQAAESEIESRVPRYRADHYGYWLLVIAGVGIFCGCVGKSAQFPLHVWLPDAMEGPTPVSALVHSATMVAAGVYLTGRFYPVFTPEARLVIAYTGGITLFLAATIAITATDIKRVLAYSTVSQLGYMMLALGVGGWVAGLFHLITHAFFKSLLFLCSGSVIHACHTNEMPKMGGLLKKMPWTGYTMLVGCLAIIGAGLPPIFGFWPFGFGLSGFYSKDSIIAQAYSFWMANPTHGAILFGVAAGGASMTAFYMFRLWFMTFAGAPRDHHVYDHAHESPRIMYVPLVILASFAVVIGWTLPGVWSVTDLLEQARWPGEAGAGVLMPNLVYPSEHLSHEHEVHLVAGLTAFSTALGGFLLAAVFYGLRWLNPNEVRQQFSPIYGFLINKWYFDELYEVLFVRPAHFVGAVVSWFDKQFIDGFINNLARWTKGIAGIDDLIDRYFVDGLVNLLAAWTWSLGDSLRGLQTGKLRQYVMLIVIGVVALTIIVNFASAG
jgi:NADH:ubiquinone oxidoreductase subunit 5 (subunit L)/multisubunit Na+/H+ antiporter MnhA subunit